MGAAVARPVPPLVGARRTGHRALGPWNDRFCLDISRELVDIINDSWARPEPIPPYRIYVKMAYHLSQEARAGLAEFRIPSDFGNTLFEFQKAAVRSAAHHLNKRGGVVIGDVVGLGKTLMATALARIFEDEHGVETLIICPRNLVRMWEDSVTESQFAILRAAECVPDTAALPRHEGHHEMVANGVKLIVETERTVGGQLGRPSGARFRTYERLKAYAEDVRGTLFDTAELRHAVEEIYKFPLLQSATDTLNRQLKSGVSNQTLAELVIALRQDARLCRVADDPTTAEPQVICSLGLRAGSC